MITKKNPPKVLFSENIPMSGSPPVVGHTLALARDPLSFLKRQQEIHGEIFRLKFGSWEVIFVTSWRLAARVLDSSAELVGKNQRQHHFLEGFGAEGMPMSSYLLWRTQRSSVQRYFTKRAALKRLEVFSDFLAEELSSLGRRDPMMWDPQKALHRTSLRFTAEGIFESGLAIEDADEWSKVLGDAFELIGPMVFFENLPLVARWYGSRFKKNAARIQLLTRRQLAIGKILPYFISEEARKRHDDDLLVDEIVSMLMAGKDTSSTTATWALYRLAKDSTLQEKCKYEVDQVVGKQNPEPHHLMELVFVSAFLKEVLRLDSPGVLINREALQPFELGGYVLEPGSAIAISLPLVHRSREIWNEPEQFMPSRWLKNPEGSSWIPTRKTGEAWIPFGRGPRNCVGMHMGFMQAFVSIVTILQRFKVLLDPGTQHLAENPRFATVNRPRDGFRLVLQEW